MAAVDHIGIPARSLRAEEGGRKNEEGEKEDATRGRKDETYKPY
jgi:hypothetical protein